MDAEFGKVYKLDQMMGQFYCSPSPLRLLCWCDDTRTCIGATYLPPIPATPATPKPAR